MHFLWRYLCGVEMPSTAILTPAIPRGGGGGGALRPGPPHSQSKDVRISVLKSANKGGISSKIRMSANFENRGLFSR